MNKGVILLDRNEPVAAELRHLLEGEHELIVCGLLSELAEQVQKTPAYMVMVHADADIVGDLSAGRFVAELNEIVESGSIVALLGADCPSHLSALLEKSADTTLPMPLNHQKLKALLSSELDPEVELAGFWMGLPHKELHGRSRSLVTFTPEMFEMMNELKLAAKHDVTVLLVGETGSGKTHLARLVHELSNRRDERLCTVACGALPPDLIESELFGYVKGAFTGADRDKEGKFAAAGNGTLLLDEIDVLTLDQQAKLLRVIENGEYEPVGSNDTVSSQARLIVASNYNLEDLVHAGTFRIDLYYRLNILKFRLLPLRERPWDIEYLARKFALEHSRTHDIPLREIDSGFLDALRQYHWPGNIREMDNVIRRAVLYCQRGVLTVKDLPGAIREIAIRGVTAPHDVALTAGPSRGSGLPLAGRTSTGTPDMTGHALRAGHVGTALGGGEESESGEKVGYGQSKTLEARVDIIERRIIEDCLKRNNHRRKETAAELGISRVTLYNKMKKFGLMG